MSHSLVPRGCKCCVDKLIKFKEILKGMEMPSEMIDTPVQEMREVKEIFSGPVLWLEDLLSCIPHGVPGNEILITTYDDSVHINRVILRFETLKEKMVREENNLRDERFWFSESVSLLQNRIHEISVLQSILADTMAKMNRNEKVPPLTQILTGEQMLLLLDMTS